MLRISRLFALPVKEIWRRRSWRRRRGSDSTVDGKDVSQFRCRLRCVPWIYIHTHSHWLPAIPTTGFFSWENICTWNGMQNRQSSRSERYQVCCRCTTKNFNIETIGVWQGQRVSCQQHLTECMGISVGGGCGDVRIHRLTLRLFIRIQTKQRKFCVIVVPSTGSWRTGAQIWWTRETGCAHKVHGSWCGWSDGVHTNTHSVSAPFAVVRLYILQMNTGAHITDILDMDVEAHGAHVAGSLMKIL